jgi:hypothetical protein
VPHRLLRSQQNSVFEAIQAAGLDPAEFKWEERFGEWSRYDTIPVLVHERSGGAFMFDIDSDHDDRISIYVPGREQDVDNMRSGGWPGQLMLVGVWLENLKREHYAPNLWAELDKQRKLTAALEPSGGDADNAPFTPEEQGAIAVQLNEIKELLVRTEGINGDRLAALEAGIAYLTEASTRMGRRDWLTVFYGTVFGWALNGLVSPDGARQALMTAAHAFGQIFGHPLPQIPG